MREPLYDLRAKKQTVSLTINGDLYARAKLAGVNASQVAEQALTEALAIAHKEKIRAEIAQDLAAYNAYVDEHGSPAELARAHYGTRE